MLINNLLRNPNKVEFQEIIEIKVVSRSLAKWLSVRYKLSGCGF